VLGILTVTSEWSQRTALTTFTLVPSGSESRSPSWSPRPFSVRCPWSRACWSRCSATPSEGLWPTATGSWHLGAASIGQALLFQVLGVVMGVAFGMLLMNSPVSGAAEWLDLNGAMEPLSAGDLTGDEGGQLATSSLLWIVVPLVVGVIRLLRREVK
jgi:ABC-2 type transport system permease protein